MATQQIDGGRQIVDGSIVNQQIGAAAGITSTKLANWSANRDAGNYKLVNLGNPGDPQDAATKAYVDNLQAGQDWKDSCRAASTGNVAGTYNATGGASGRGQFTAMPNAIDGVNLAQGDRVLLKDQSTGAQNGVWVVTTLGTGSDGVWDRATDFDEDAEVTSAAVIPAEEGTSNADTVWLLTTNNPITIGGASGTALTFTQWYTAVSAGAGLTQTGSVIDVAAGDASIAVTADSIAVQKSGGTLATDGSGLKVADGGITGTQLAASVAGGGLDGGGGSALSVSFINEEATGTKNGSNTAFTISASIVAGSEVVWLNGVKLKETTHYSISGTNLTMVDAPESTDDLWIWALKA